MTFSLILFLLTVFTGVLWVLDVFIWAPKRRAAAQDELTAFDRDNADSLRRGEQTVVATRNAIVQASTDRPKWLEYTAGFFPVIFFIFIRNRDIFARFFMILRLLLRYIPLPVGYDERCERKGYNQTQEAQKCTPNRETQEENGWVQSHRLTHDLRGNYHVGDDLYHYTLFYTCTRLPACAGAHPQAH